MPTYSTALSGAASALVEIFPENRFYTYLKGRGYYTTQQYQRCIETLKPDSWKGYTIGDPIFLTKKGSNWRLDDESRV